MTSSLGKTSQVGLVRHSQRILISLLVLLSSHSAWAGSSDWMALTEYDPLIPGVTSTLWVARSEGQLSLKEPKVVVNGGRLRPQRGQSWPGFWTFSIVPNSDAKAVEIQIGEGPQKLFQEIAVEVPALSQLRVANRVDALAGNSRVTFSVTADDLPAPSDLRVVVPGGDLVNVASRGNKLEVTIEVEESPYPRVLLVALQDNRRRERPIWTKIYFRARPKIPLQVEPGAWLLVEVSGREYGPFQADEKGAIVAKVEQFPGELSATARLTDDLGNQTTTELPLSGSASGVLSVVADGVQVPGISLPLVYLYATRANGRPLRTQTPNCRTPSVGELDLVSLGKGHWMLALPERAVGQLRDLRVDCSLGAEVSNTLRIAMAKDVPARVRLRTWPVELSTDYPVAEVQVVLEDGSGERLPLANVEVTANRGVVRMEPMEGYVARGEYLGGDAVNDGEDTIYAVYTAPLGVGSPRYIRLGYQHVPVKGPFEIRARVLNAKKRPLSERMVVFSVDDTQINGLTDDEGWAVISTTPPEGRAPIRVSAALDGVVVQRLIPRNVPNEIGGVGADLEDIQQVSITPGRVSGVVVDLEPPILHTGKGAVGHIVVSLEDRFGNLITDESVEIEASEGDVGPVLLRPDGTYFAEYTPIRKDRRREVLIGARIGHVRSSATLQLEPRPARVSIGPSAGYISNFVGVASPFVSIDADVRTAFVQKTMMVRIGVSGHFVEGEAETGFGDRVRLRAQVYPISLGALFRMDKSGGSLWAGVAGIAGPQDVETRFGDSLVERAVKPVFGGSVFAGAGYRVGPGEFFASVRWLGLVSIPGDLGFSGNVGGLAASAGYRIVY